MSKIVSIGISNPELCLSQEESWKNLNLLKELSPIEKKYYKKFMLDDGIKTRYLALDKLEHIFSTDQDEIIGRYSKAAPQIAKVSTISAIDKANIQKGSVDFLSTATCTGYLCPGLSSYIVEEVSLRSNISILDLQGMGCGAALPNLHSADCFLSKKKEKSYAIANCTEICSAAVVWDDDLGLILSNSIFADGSASALLTNDPKAKGPEILDYQVLIYPEKRDALRFKSDKGRLRNTLSAIVPGVAAIGVENIVSKLLKNNNLTKKNISFWALHTGGRKVLDTIGAKISLTNEDLEYSRDTLKKYGNMSSPSVLFALEKVMGSGLPKPGDYGIILSFGAGFSCYGMLLKW